MIYKEYEAVIDTRISHPPQCKRNQRFCWSITTALGKPMESTLTNRISTEISMYSYNVINKEAYQASPSPHSRRSISSS